jgi:hypothetical protein
MPPGHIAFALATVPGLHYRVETATDLFGQPWETAGELIAPGEALVFTVPAGELRRFYRVVLP